MTTIHPDSPLKIRPWIPIGMTVAGFVYLVIAMLAGGGH